MKTNIPQQIKYLFTKVLIRKLTALKKKYSNLKQQSVDDRISFLALSLEKELEKHYNLQGNPRNGNFTSFDFIRFADREGRDGYAQIVIYPLQVGRGRNDEAVRITLNENMLEND